MKDMATNVVESAQKVGGDADEFMLKHYNDPKLNSYEEGPGSNLPEQIAVPNENRRLNCAVYLACVPANLDPTGIENLCSKFGQVNDVQKRQRRHEIIFDAVVKFASVADAENAIYNINKLRFKAKGRTMKADFDNPHKRSSEKPQIQAEPVHGEIPNKFDLPLATPSSLPKPKEIDDQRMNILLKSDRQFPTTNNGCPTYRHLPNSIAMMEEVALKSIGDFDEKTQHFVHNAALDFAIPEQCKKCHSLTMKRCKSCRDPFCSMNCLNAHNGCYCVCSRTAEAIEKKPIRSSVGRGARLLSHLEPPPRLWSSTSSSDYDTTSSFETHPVIQIEPCDRPKNNSLVVITNVISNKTVLLRSFESKDNERYLKYLNDVVEYAKTAEPLTEMPKIGDIVLAEHDGCHYRVLVARIENNGATVAVLELGSVVFIPMNKLKKLREDLQTVQRFLFKGNLSGMERQEMKTDKCLIYLYELLDKRVPLKFIHKKVDTSSSGDLYCELVVNETNESVNGKLITLNQIKLGQLVMLRDIPIEPFDVNATELIVIDNSLAIKGVLTVAKPEDMSNMFDMHHRIQEYCKERYEGQYTPSLNEICLAKCNDQWYRVKLDKSFGDKSPVMFFIDFALFNKVHVNDLRVMPSEFKFPIYSGMAEIDGITDTTDLNKLAETFPSMSKVSVTKVEFVNGNTDELRICFDVPGGFPEISVPKETPKVHQPRQRFLENLRRKYSPQADELVTMKR